MPQRKRRDIVKERELYGDLEKEERKKTVELKQDFKI